MKWILTIIVLSAITFFTFYRVKSSPVKPSHPNSKSFALLELFTSEGCSSCPPADRLLPELIKDPNTIALSFHVDYWDHLGWKDSFSDASFTERQRQYAGQFQLETVYTPQLVINGQYEMVGSNRTKAERFIEKAKQTIPLAEIELDSVKEEDHRLKIICRLSGDIKNSRLLTALVQKHAERKIGAGENMGATLTHANVVRSFVENDAASKMEFTVGIPAGLEERSWQLILYTQRKTDLQITGATTYQ